MDSSKWNADGIVTMTETPMDRRNSGIRRPLSTPLFTGRSGILSKLEKFFVRRRSKTYLRREFLMYGMGGAGKTQVSLKFAETNEDWYASTYPTTKIG